ncbi:MAG: hypothetical protein MUE87_01190 [Methanothrix sp.]|jgi:hypothetical protein|nr:hypothetical protein [Methanothrix sp.]
MIVDLMDMASRYFTILCHRRPEWFIRNPPGQAAIRANAGLWKPQSAACYVAQAIPKANAPIRNFILAAAA